MKKCLDIVKIYGKQDGYVYYKTNNDKNEKP